MRQPPSGQERRSHADADPEWFGPSDRPLLGFVHGARPGRRAPGVVICPPIARELQGAHYSLRRLADTLGAAGLVAVRFDYDGTGDSAGADGDPGRVGAWLESIGHAAALARARGATSVSLVGVRMGALLAELAARRLGDLEALVLWDPCASGRAFVRQQRALQLLSDAGAPSPDELLGFRLDEASLEELAHLDVPVAEAPVARRVLLLHRPKDPEIGRFLGRLGDAAVDCRPIRPEDQLDVNPFEHKVPRETLAGLSEWLVGALAPPVQGGGAEPSALRPSDARAAAATVVPESPCGPIVERVRCLGPVGLVGIETVPARCDPRRPTLLFLTSATDHRIGPSRFWVQLAREWAALGFRSVRFDASGIGDSPVRSGQQDQLMRPVEAFDDVLDVAAAVSPEDPSNVVLVGLCSGAYQALETALELAPRGVLVVNPAVVFTPPEVRAGGPMAGRRRICRLPSAPLRSIRRVPAGLRQRMLPATLRRRVTLSLSRTGRPPRDRTADVWLRELAALGVDAYLVCGDEEGRGLVEEASGALPALEATGLVALEVLEGLDHAMIPAAHRRRVGELLGAHLRMRFGGPCDDLPVTRTVRPAV